MKRIAVVALMAVGILFQTALAPAKERTVKVRLESLGGSSVFGIVQLSALPQGGSRMEVMARGMEPGRLYGVFYHPGTDGEGPVDLLDTFTAGKDGSGEAFGAIEEVMEDVGSVTIRFGPEFGTRLARARLR